MIDKGFIKEAIHCYVTAIRLMPRFSAAHSNLGSVFKEQGKLQQAIAHYQEAIKIDPSFADAFSNLGMGIIEYIVVITWVLLFFDCCFLVFIVFEGAGSDEHE